MVCIFILRGASKRLYGFSAYNRYSELSFQFFQFERSFWMESMRFLTGNLIDLGMVHSEAKLNNLHFLWKKHIMWKSKALTYNICRHREDWTVTLQDLVIVTLSSLKQVTIGWISRKRTKSQICIQFICFHNIFPTFIRPLTYVCRSLYVQNYVGTFTRVL